MICRFASLPSSFGHLVALLLAVVPVALAGEPPATPPTSQPLREQSIYIPYDKLREVFEREGRGVFLPYEQFQELWRTARAATLKPCEGGPPVEAVISEAVSEARVERDVMRVSAALRIEVLRSGWHEIPLRLGDAAITAATIGGQPARILTSGDQGYRLLLEKQGEGRESIELLLEYAKAFAKSPGQNSVSFDAPRAPVSRWRVRIPGGGIKVNIQPLLAATEVPADDESGKPADETVVLAFVGAAPTVRIDWTPRAEGAQGLQALQSVQSVQRLWIDEGVLRTRVELTYEITRLAAERLTVEVPSSQKVVNVFDANVRQWSVQAGGAVQTITAELFEPALGTQRLLVELEQFGAEERGGELTVPLVRAMGVNRQQGLLAVGVAEGLRVEPLRRAGLIQVDAEEVPKTTGDTSGGGPWALSYRYAAVPFELALRVEKIEPRIAADALVEATLEPELLAMTWQGVYEIDKAGVFRLELEVPAGYEVRSVRGAEVAKATPAAVESHHLTNDAPPRLIVNLGRKALGRIGLAVELTRRLSEPDLMTPTGQSVDVNILAPRVVGMGIERTGGRLVIYPAEALRVNPASSAGVRPIPLAEGLQGIEPAVKRGGADAAAASGLAFAFAGEPASVSIKVERRRPHITVRQLLVARIESGVVRYEATFFCQILYSAVPQLRIDIPSELAGSVQNATAGLREARLESAVPPPAEGYTAWALRGDSGLKGDITIRLAWEVKLDSLEIGKSADFVVPQLRPVGADRAWGQVALAKAETLDIRPTGANAGESPIGLRPIDPQHDLLGAPDTLKASVARAFEFHEADWALGVRATRYKLEEVKGTSIERGLVRIVVTRGGHVAAQALYRLRSALQRLPLKLAPGAQFDTDPVRLNGRPVALERGQQDEFFVPLIGQNPDQPFVLEIRYTVGDGGTHLACPEFPSDPAVQKVYLCAFLPPEWAYLGARGPWTDEVQWRWNDVTGFEPLPPRDDLVPWVTAGVNMMGDAAETFQTDGQPYLFSALRPAAPPTGTLALVTVREWVLHAAIVAGVLVLGMLLLRARAPGRLFATGAFCIALVLAGVFLPTFSRQIVNGALLSAILIVMIVWFVWYLAWTRPRAMAHGRASPNTPAALAGSPVTGVPGGGTPPDGSSDEADVGNGGPTHA